MLDPYGNRLTYAVTAELTPPNALSVPGAAGGITISPTISGTPIANAEFALISHGRTGAGSYTAEGVLNPESCDTDNAGDSENCDGDAVFSELERTLADTPDFSDDTLAFDLSNDAINAVCAAGQYLFSINNGIPDCRGFDTLSCPDGQVLTKFDTSGNPVCVAGLLSLVDCAEGEVLTKINGEFTCVTGGSGTGAAAGECQRETPFQECHLPLGSSGQLYSCKEPYGSQVDTFQCVHGAWKQM